MSHSNKVLTEGSITGNMLRFAVPLILGNLLQQCYNIADTLIVGRALGADALAAVGSSYALIVFVTSVFIGLSMGVVLFFPCNMVHVILRLYDGVFFHLF